MFLGCFRFYVRTSTCSLQLISSDNVTKSIRHSVPITSNMATTPVRRTSSSNGNFYIYILFLVQLIFECLSPVVLNRGFHRDVSTCTLCVCLLIVERIH